MGTAGNRKNNFGTNYSTGIQTPFYILSAINSGVRIFMRSEKRGGLFTTKNPILFIDEIHRFSKSQQDSLLAAVEKGWITLIEPQPKIPALKLFLPYYPLSSLCIKRLYKRRSGVLLQRALKQILFSL
jgi:putative ATPase